MPRRYSPSHPFELLRGTALLYLFMATFLRWGFFPVAVPAQEPPADPEPPTIAAASEEGRRAMRSFRLPEGWQVRQFAAEPDVANPVAFCIDGQGLVYVCESFRQNRGVTDNRGHDEKWLDADLAAQTVQDRIRYHLELLGPSARDYTRFDDRIRLLMDTDGDGQVDRTTVFADHFHHLEDGTGAGVLAYRGNVYYTCIPKLWLLRDEDGDGRADVRTVLHDGFGVRVAFRGHDLHGLIIGPDGRLYFSIGDRGYHIELPDRTIADPESGAVFRCELDGSNLEVVATGLRNPQELAFDEFGNLFTGDNNSDSGDRARWVYVVEGGDSGWRMAYQYLPDRGPFNREKIWHPFHEGQPAYIVPPVANVADGPSGLAYYPGTGLDDSYRGTFFLCDFRGTPGNSGVRTLRVQPQGAFFELVDDQQTIWSILATDVTFGPDGGLYVSDWVNGWDGEGKGRIYRFAPRENPHADVTREVRELLAADLDARSESELAALLSHADQRVRQEAQFALVRRGARGALERVARDGDRLLARLHAIWGLGQLDRAAERPSAGPLLVALLRDAEPEVRCNAARVLGDLRIRDAAAELRPLLRDRSTRVRYFAAQALGRLAVRDAFSDVVRMLAENADQDPVLRHGGIMALAGIGDADALADLSNQPSRAVRLAGVVALRRLKSPQVARFLTDPDVAVVVEAARAIHDVPIAEALPALAALAESAPRDDALLRRVLNANFRLGKAENALAVARFAAQGSAPESLRREAVRMLSDWSTPSSRDRVLGMWRPLEPRDPAVARDALQAVLPSLLAQSGDELRSAALDLAARLGIGQAAPMLKQILADQEKPGRMRGSALRALQALHDPDAERLATELLQDDQADVRMAACRVLAATRPDLAIEELGGAVESQAMTERQQALAILAEMKHPAADAILAERMRALIEGRLPADTELDVLEAAAARADEVPTLQSLLAQFRSTLNPNEPSSFYRASLFGGDAERGRRIFFERTDVSCVRCHKVAGQGGEVGPDLTHIAKEKDRKYLLESIVDPNRAVADAFKSVILVDDSGRVLTGIIKRETDEELELLTAEGKLVVVSKDSIDDRADGKSAMPQDVGKHLSPSDLRDLVSWLATLK